MNITILIGSPKGKNSASNNIAAYINSQFSERGFNTEIIYLVQRQETGKLSQLIDKTSSSDLIMLIAPLYIDSIPAITINYMEQYYNQQKNKPGKEQKLMVIFNCGFPEPNQNDLAIAMCKNFAKQTGMEWMGGITIGMGAAFEHQNLNDAGRMSINLRKGLNMAIDSLIQDRTIPVEAVTTASKPLLPLFLITFIMVHFGGWMWKNRLQDKKRLNDQPYLT